MRRAISNMKESNNSGQDFRIIGIGASAGGLEALQSFLSNLNSEMKAHALIIAQHVSPTYKSMLVQLLSKSSVLPVIEAENNGEVLPGFVYITPPDTEIILSNNKFVLRKPKKSSGPKPSIDILFQSLAQKYRERAIGVILSGTGSDGSFGITEIKAEGGLTIAQDPKSSKFDGMPISAIETGNVDLILFPDKMGEQILSYINNPLIKREKAELMEWEASALYQILQSLSSLKGTDFSNYKQTTIIRRVEKRIEMLKLANMDEYKLYLDEHIEEYDLLFETILIGVTSFYRDEDAFLSIEEYLESIIAGKSKGDSIRIWTPGCSTGEEAYSIASIIANLLKDRISHYNIQIFATDIDEKAIQFARKAIYPNTSSFLFKSISDTSYFVQKADSFEIAKSLRSMVLFTKHDLTRNPPFLKLDMVICRNLLIYFSQNLQQQIIPLFHYALNPNGILFLGKSETIGNFSDLFVSLDAKNKIFQRKRGGTLQTLRFAGFRANSTVLIPATSKDVVRKDLTVSEMLKETLYNTFDYPYVIITDNYNIEMINGDVNLFLTLPEGVMNANILKMIRHELQLELRFTLTKVIREKQPQRSEIIHFVSNDKNFIVVIKARPLLYTHKNNDLYMIIFELYPDQVSDTIPHLEGSEIELIEKINTLEKELASTKDHLQVYIEELETSNEELQSLNEEVQSTNEELQSTNEELETSIEELQSTNEEIQIAYTELKSTNDELTKKDNLLKLKESSQAALLNNSLQSFILTDNHYKILAFNDKAKSTFLIFFKKHIRIGDDLLELLSGSHFPNLSEDLIKLEKGEIISGETIIRNLELQEIFLAYNFSPVLDLSKNLSVISISFLDVSFTKVTENNLRKAENLLKSIFQAVETGICITDKNGIFVSVNQAYCNIYGYTKEELIGNPFTIVVLPEARAQVQRMHDQFISGVEEMPQEWFVQRKNGSIIEINANSKLVIDEDGTRYKVTSVRDISEKKKFQRLLLETQVTAHVGGWEYDLITNSLSLTAEAYHLLDLPINSKQDFNSIASLFREKEREKLLFHLELAVKQQTPFDILLEFFDKLNRKFYFKATGTHQDHPSQSKKIFGSFQDITERINYELQIQKTNELLEQTNAIARVGGWEVILETKSINWTKVTKEIHEVSLDYLPNFETAFLFYKEGHNRDRIHELFDNLVLNGQDFDDEFEIVTHQNKTKWVRVTGRASIENGKTVRLFGAFQDIHESKLTSETIRIAKERYDFLARASNDAIWDWDIKNDTLFLGEGFRAIFGYETTEEYSSIQKLMENIYPEDVSRVRAAFSRMIDSEKETQLTLEFRFKKSNNTYATVLSKSYAIRDKFHKTERIIGSFQDFTKAKQEEHHLKLLESVITNASDSVIITEAEPFSLPGPRIVYVNQAFTKMTGYSAEDAIGRSPRFLQGPKTDMDEMRKLRQAMEKWEPCEVQVVNYKKNGEEFWNHFSIFPLANENGWYTHWIAIEKDITKKKLEEDEREKLIAELTQNNIDLKQFTYITSHNLRAPLSNLTAALNVIDDLPLTDPMLTELLKGIRVSTNNLNQTINDLIKILIIKDSPAIEQTQLSFKSVFTTVTDQLSNIIQSSQAEISTSFEEAEYVTFNRSYLESIFLNLLTNSIRYASPKRSPQIKIRSSLGNNFVKITFEDNGLGIDMLRNKDKIFGLYQRFHDMPDSKGLGLYLVKSQVHSLGGSITVESEVDKGTKFTILFKK